MPKRMPKGISEKYWKGIEECWGICPDKQPEPKLGPQVYCEHGTLGGDCDYYDSCLREYERRHKPKTKYTWRKECFGSYGQIPPEKKRYVCDLCRCEGACYKETARRFDEREKKPKRRIEIDEGYKS